MSLENKKSQALFQKAQTLIPGGVNSPVRACRSVGCDPLFIAQGKGSHLTTVDGQDLVDFVLAWGPMILGHAHPSVTQAVEKALQLGTSYGAPCPSEVTLAEKVCQALPSVEMVRMVNSGTEATMSALRLARGITKRNKLIKFIGCYHGHGDAFLAAAGSGLATLSIPGTPGVPASTVADTLLAPYNDLNAVQRLFDANKDQIAALIVEPVAANMGLVLPQPGFLEGLRELCTANNTLLIFDEVITGFRLAYGGAQARFNILPDLTTFGKIIGGGLPVGAYGGKKEYMQHISPQGDVYQAGTLSGNPLAMAAGIATLAVLEKADYSALERKVDAFATALEDILKSKTPNVHVVRTASMFTTFFAQGPLHNFEQIKAGISTQLFASYFQQMLKQGIYFGPAAFETGMVSFSHSDQDFAATLEAAKKLKF